MRILERIGSDFFIDTKIANIPPLRAPSLLHIDSPYKYLTCPPGPVAFPIILIIMFIVFMRVYNALLVGIVIE